MISDILMVISIFSVFISLIPACISDYKTRLVDVSTWKYAAYIGIPCGIFSFIIKLFNNEIIMPSLILSILSVIFIIFILVILANIRDPFYNPTHCDKCNYPINTISEMDKCPKCNNSSSKAILGGADMIALDIILITSFYISDTFIMTFIFSFCVISALVLGIIYLVNKDFALYRVPLIIPITISYAISLILLMFSVNVVKLIHF